MCGICGYISDHRPPEMDVLLRMNDALIHRGPDAGNIYMDKKAGLGNRRLKVIDLSDAGNQPMTSADGRYIMVYNGEVYNYSELRKEYLNSHSFRSNSDTEVVLELFSKLGIASLSKLNGMFAIAIYDTQSEELILARDPSGIKPLYYFYDTSGSLYFASELNAFREIPGISLEINRAVVPLFLHLGYIPAPQSIYRNIYKLQPGHWIKTNGRSLECGDWKVEHKKERWKDEGEASKNLEELLSDAIRLQLRSDVPFGIFLSGGIDSSLLTALAVKGSSQKIKTFSIGFKESKFDESEYSRQVAEKLGTEHHPFIVSLDDATHLFDQVTEIYGEPFADSSAIPTLMVSKKAREHVTVALSGEGGDELFMGYGSYKWARRLNDNLWRSGRHMLGFLLNFSGESRNKRVAELLKFGPDTFLEGHIFSQEQYFFSDQELLECTNSLLGVGPSWFDEYVQELQTNGQQWSPAERQSHFDQHYYLPDDLLVKVDRASMHFSLEVRVPYLDPRVIAMADQLPENMKWKRGETKWILKNILYKHLPHDLFHRPKQGFTIPLESWLKDRWEKYIEEFLNQKVVERYGLVKFESVQAFLLRYRQPGNQYLYNRIWALITLHRWLVKFHP